MAKNRDQKNNFRAAVDAAKTAFGEVKNAAKAYEAAEASEKEKRLELLEAMYSFVESRRSDQKEVLKAFVRENNEKWAKPAEKNPYQPIAKIVFPNKAASTHTWYSQVLGYASNSNVQPGTLADWLKQHEGGMEGAYKAAVTHFGSGRIKGGAAYRSERLDRARDKFGKAEVSTSFKMTAPVDIESGFVVALLRVDAGGEARVVEIVEQDQQAVEETLLRYVQVDEVVDNALKGKPLYELYRAVHLIHGIVPTEESDTERLILVINGAKSGKEKTRLFSASRSLNQVWAEVVLKAPLPDLPKSKLYFFSQKQAGNFRGQFLPNTEWSLLSPEDEKSDFRLSIEGKTKARLSPLDTEVGEKLYLSDDQGKRSCQLMLTHNSMGAYLNGIRDLRERIKRANEKSDRKQSLPKLLKLEARNGRVVGVPIGTKGIAFTLFETAGSPKFTEERYVAAEEFERVCDTLLRYGQNVEGWLIDKGVHNSALLLKHTFDTDEFTLVLPLMISTNADRAAISKPFDAEPVGA